MIPNITHSTGAGNYLGYNLGDKRDQHQKVRLLGAEGVIIDELLVERLNQNWTAGNDKEYQAFRKVSKEIAKDLDEQFRSQAAMNGRPKIRAINVSLSYSPEDTEKVDEIVYDETLDDYIPLRLQMGREFLEGMGFGDCQWVATSHLETNCAHDHFVINTVRADGSTINLKFDFVRAQKVAADIRKKHGLTLPQENLQAITPKAKKILETATSLQDFETQLKKEGIEVIYAKHSDTGEIYGISFKNRKKVIPGSKLSRSLTYGNITKKLSKNAGQSKKANAGRENAKAVFDTYYNLLITSDKAYHLFIEARDAGYAFRNETLQKFEQLKSLRVNIHKQDEAAARAQDKANKEKAYAAAIMLLNPFVGILALFLAALVEDIRDEERMRQTEQLKARIKDIRNKITELEYQKDQLAVPKKLQNYLTAKNAYHEYKAGMTRVDQVITGAQSGQVKPKKTETTKKAVPKHLKKTGGGPRL